MQIITISNLTDKQLEKVVDSKSLDADDCQTQTIVSEIFKKH